ncbi:MAG: hypothetical protein EOO03_04515 [Chitinophagaceae bacterium]|nr:MAG: hypothetical protein EOO03_04515 [Chitinophagaceae bacterium]
MANTNNLPEQSDSEDIRAQFEDERTQARIREHLENEHDVITEEDIANIQVGAVAPADPMVTAAADDAVASAEPVTNGTSSAANVETPWNILD